MKLSKSTQEVLANFASIYNSMHVHKGKSQRTNPVSRTSLAEVTLEEEFPVEFGIFNMNQFLAVLSSFKEPSIDFDKQQMVVHEGKHKVTYRYCDVALISKKLIPMDKTLDLKSVDVTFDLPKETLAKVLQSTSILGLEHIAIAGDGDVIGIKSINPTDPNYHQTFFEIGETDKTFQMNINLDNLKILPHNYKVNISSTNLSKFISQDMNLIYTIACEKDSTFG